jgi:preprotein translocase subunit SecA
MNQQREMIYQHRQQALGEESLRPVIEEMIGEKAEEIVERYSEEKTPPSEWDLKGMRDAIFEQFNFRMGLDPASLEGVSQEKLADQLQEAAVRRYEEKRDTIGAQDFREIERIVMLQTVDNLWKDHLLSMDHLKEGIGLRGYAQQDPVMVYKKEAFEMFQDLIYRIKEETLKILFRIQITESSPVEELAEPKEQEMTFSHGDASQHKKQPVKRDGRKVGRNDPCPCGSGKKYKKCCGQ